jgi:hypothetical protein
MRRSSKTAVPGDEGVVESTSNALDKHKVGKNLACGDPPRDFEPRSGNDGGTFSSSAQPGYSVQVLLDWHSEIKGLQRACISQAPIH